MKIFVGFGYNANDKWIKELIFPIIKCFNGEVITGEDLHGEVITQECIERIKNADGMLAFLTRSDQLKSKKFTTHRWVTDELSTAISNRISAVEIRDINVDVSGGISGDRQRIEFDENKKELLIVKIAEVLAQWRRKLIPKRLLLLPEAILKEVKPHIKTGKVKCSYQFKVGNRDTSVIDTTPFPLGQGLCVDVYNIPSEESLIQVCITGPDIAWCSSFVSVHLLSINLEKE